MTKKTVHRKCGGVFFFSSLIFTYVFSILFSPAALNVIATTSTWTRWRGFLGGMLLGLGLVKLLISGKTETLLHEIRHNVFSGFVGNKPKKIEVHDKGGSFEYEYTQETAKFNAFISLAPYFLPFFTLLTFPIWCCILNIPSAIRAGILGAAYAADIRLNLQDIHPGQTDFTDLNGGFFVGVLYVIGFHIAFSILIFTWVGGDYKGVFEMLSETFLYFFQLVRPFFGNA